VWSSAFRRYCCFRAPFSLNKLGCKIFLLTPEIISCIATISLNLSCVYSVEQGYTEEVSAYYQEEFSCHIHNKKANRLRKQQARIT
jgi:hypothetical protein